ncbi:MAG: folate-binding protein YgfZ [Acidimicrobiia bacterium]|nr:folate-binding protein YgfZ [Acidimicrobiia bacterium]
MSLTEPHLAPSSPELVWFGGSDAIRFLNDLVSQEIGDMEPGTVRRSLLLTPQGKLDHIMWVLRGADDIGLVVDAGRGEDLVAKLGRYRIRVDVDIEPSPLERWLVVGPFGGDPGRWTGDRSALVADVSWSNVERALVVGSRPDLPLFDVDHYEKFRIEAGEPLMGVDVTDATIPQETGLVGETISFDKGCFLGQELVARLDSRGGRVNHHLRILRFDGSAPEVGEPVSKEDEHIGTMTSSAGDVGLGLLRRGIEPGEIVKVGRVQGVVEAVPED